MVPKACHGADIISVHEDRDGDNPHKTAHYAICKSVDEVRGIRDQIDERVKSLVGELLAAGAAVVGSLEGAA